MQQNQEINKKDQYNLNKLRRFFQPIDIIHFII
ncbi:Uncharacterised protein [Enterobacter hormaechei]|nr:Uncharacterised protein [Enterobacter hormaechei]